MFRRPARAALVLFVYAAVAGGITWPLVANITDHLPYTSGGAPMDGLHSAWVLAYQTHALATDPAHFGDANMFHPTRHALFYGQTATGAVPYFALPYLATGNVAVALNVTLLAGLILTATALHVVVLQWTASHGAGFLAGLVFLSTRWVLWSFAPSVPQYALLLYFPFIILLAARPRLSTRATVVLAVLAALQSLMDVVYVAAAVLAPLGLLAVGLVIAGGPRRAKGWRVLAAVTFAAVCIVPIHVGHWAVRVDNPGLGAQTTWPIGQYPLTSLQDLRMGLSPTAIPYLGLMLIVLGALLRARGARSTRSSGTPWAYAAFFAVTGFLMSLKPPGRTDVSPDALDGLLTFDLLRVPLRLGVVGLVALCLLVGLGFAETERAIVGRMGARRGRVVSAALVLLVALGMQREWRLGDSLFFPGMSLPGTYPLQAVSPPEPEVLAMLRTQPGPLLELPVRDGLPGTRGHALAMYRSTYHWHPILNGYDGYWPSGFPERMKLAQRLPDAEALEALHRDTGLRLVLVRTAEIVGAERTKWMAAAMAGGVGHLRLAARGESELLFRVDLP